MPPDSELGLAPVQVPNLDRSGIIAGGQPLVVGAERYARHIGRRLQADAALCVYEVEHSGSTRMASGQSTTIRRECDAHDQGEYLRQDRPSLACLQVPDRYSLTYAGQPTIWRKCHATDPAKTAERADYLPGAQVPDLHPHLSAAGQPPTIRRECHTPDGAPMVLQGEPYLPSR